MQKELKILNEYFIRIFKSTVEYKTNFIAYNLGGFAYIASIIAYAFLLSENFIQTSKELNIFIATIFFIYISENILSTIWSKGSLFTNIQNGKLNEYMYKPTDTFVHYYSNIGENPILIMILNCICFGYFLYALNLDIMTWISILITYVCIIILGIAIALFIESLSWIANSLNYIFDHIQGYVSEVFLLYPYSFFQNFPYRFMLFISSAYFIILFIVPQMINNTPSYANLQWLIISEFTLIIVSYQIWQWGLKRYNAYG